MRPDGQPQRNEDRPDRSDPLDELLDKARWPTPGPERLERLMRQWEAATAPQARRRWNWAALAAGLFVGLATLGSVWLQQAEKRPLEHALRPGEDQKQQRPSDSQDVAEAPSSEAYPTSRPANLYEQVVFGASQRRARRDLADRPLTPTTAREPVSPEEPSLVDAALQTAQDVAIELRARWMRLRTNVQVRQFLAAVGQNLHQRGEAALFARSAPAVEIARAVDSSRSQPDVQRILLTTLVERGDAPSVRLFLGFVLERQTSAIALDALEDARQPPVALLFAMLGDSHQEIRMGAARALGRLDGPVISRRLADMALGNVQRREALIALVSSSGPHAVRFVQAAEHDRSLRNDVRAARFQVENL